MPWAAPIRNGLASTAETHQVDRAAHIDVDEVCINGVVEQLHTARHLVRMRRADLDSKEIFARMSLQQRPL